MNFIFNKRYIIFTVSMVLLLFIFSVRIKGDDKLHVTIDGAVQNKGVYEVSKGSRVIDAVLKAIPSYNSDISKLNLYEQLSDNVNINVPFKSNDKGSTNTQSIKEFDRYNFYNNHDVYRNYKDSKNFDNTPKEQCDILQNKLEANRTNTTLISLQDIADNWSTHSTQYLKVSQSVISKFTNLSLYIQSRTSQTNSATAEQYIFFLFNWIKVYAGSHFPTICELYKQNNIPLWIGNEQDKLFDLLVTEARP